MPRRGGKRSVGSKGASRSVAEVAKVVQQEESTAKSIDEPSSVAKPEETSSMIEKVLDIEVSTKLEDGCMACGPTNVDKPDLSSVVSAAMIPPAPTPVAPVPLLVAESSRCANSMLKERVPANVDVEQKTESQIPVATKPEMLTEMFAPGSPPPATCSLPSPSLSMSLPSPVKMRPPQLQAKPSNIDDPQEALVASQQVATAAVREEQYPRATAVDHPGPPPRATSVAPPSLTLSRPGPVRALSLEQPQAPIKAIQPAAPGGAFVQQATLPNEVTESVEEGRSSATAQEEEEVRPLTFCERFCGRGRRRQLLGAPLLRGSRFESL